MIDLLTPTAGDDFNLADALDPDNDIRDKDKNMGQGGGWKSSCGSVCVCVFPETTAEVGTIAGIASAVAMALVGAISSYISYQKKKLCFSIQIIDLCGSRGGCLVFAKDKLWFAQKSNNRTPL
uniref:CD99 antigen-like protein 2 n=1 Tax=Amphilophus citrinellus TaxID=61819 RepID=A0A3Q0S874_AMPCI